MSHIEDICRELNNWFDIKRAIGDFEITENGLTSFYDDLYDDQYYRIVGSALNDGVYKKGEEHVFAPEVFHGAVWAMAVPPAVIALCGEIDAYTEKYANQINSPFQSESFGGYSYTKVSDGNSNSSDWRSVFKGKLNKWRKINGYMPKETRIIYMPYNNGDTYPTKRDVKNMIEDATKNVLIVEGE